MDVVSETPATIETVRDVRTTREETPFVTRSPTWLSAPARLPLRQAGQRWKSSLSDQDLHCLLQVIEVDLVPRLLNSYSPARFAPDDRLASG